MSRFKNNKKPLHKSESSNSSEEEKKDEPADDQLNRSFESVASKRGRPTIPDQWTGIIVVEPGDQPIEVKIRPRMKMQLVFVWKLITIVHLK